MLTNIEWGLHGCNG